jgi:hypothetical protein
MDSSRPDGGGRREHVACRERHLLRVRHPRRPSGADLYAEESHVEGVLHDERVDLP